jgi:hypothetical protein
MIDRRRRSPLQRRADVDQLDDLDTSAALAGHVPSMTLVRELALVGSGC